MSISTNQSKFKGEIENYLIKQRNSFDSQLNSVLSTLNFKTWLCRSNIRKLDGYHASHLLFILLLLPILKLKNIHSFCEKRWQNWSSSRKDTFYRFKRNAKYRWRSFMYKINIEIFKRLDFDQIPNEEQYFVIDDTNMAKTGKKIENVSWIFDHNLNRTHSSISIDHKL